MSLFLNFANVKIVSHYYLNLHLKIISDIKHFSYIYRFYLPLGIAYAYLLSIFLSSSLLTVNINLLLAIYFMGFPLICHLLLSGFS